MSMWGRKSRYVIILVCTLQSPAYFLSRRPVLSHSDALKKSLQLSPMLSVPGSQLRLYLQAYDWPADKCSSPLD